MMDIKVSKDKHISGWVHRENFIYFMKWNQKPCVETKVTDRGKRSKTLSEIRPIEKISNGQSHIEPSHSLRQNDAKLQTHPPSTLDVKMPNLSKN